MPKTTHHKRASDNGAGEATARPFWSGTITFGLVSVPVELFPANRPARAPLRMLGPEGEPLKRKYYSPKTEKDLDADEMVRGYEYQPGKYVVVTDEELERLAPEKTRDIDLKRFVPAESIPPVYFERGYFLAPGKDSEKAYRLLTETMAKSDQAGIATFVMRGKEYLVAIFADHGILRAETMRFADEVRSPKDIGLPEKHEVPAATVRKFDRLVSGKSKQSFSPAKLTDDRTEALLKLVKRKQSKPANVVRVEEAELASSGKVVDLMEALKRNLRRKKTK